MVSPFFFLLGGHDLEMVSIRALLEAEGMREGLQFADRGLDWSGAKLSAYQDLFTMPHRFVGIELRLDADPPGRYLHIDHHNELSRLPASIEQVATLLGVELNREQQLIAANDKGYMPAMLALGASPEEVARIRRLDRKAQGVSEAMEQQAEQEVSGLIPDEGMMVVTTSLERFSPLTDRLYGRGPLLIVNQAELTYFGHSIDQLRVAYAEEIQTGRAYSGGQGHSGFFGLAKGQWTTEELERQKIRIEQIVANR